MVDAVFDRFLSIREKKEVLVATMDKMNEKVKLMEIMRNTMTGRCGC